VTDPVAQVVVAPAGATVADLKAAIDLCHVVGLLALPPGGVVLLPEMPAQGQKTRGKLITQNEALGGGARCDVLLPDGTHMYWSTHCRHAGPDLTAPGHAACAAAELAPGVPRRPAQCKTCGAACVCPCHALAAAGAAEVAAG
jgi:hypothetical protein